MFRNPQVLVFDVNETLLDLSPLEPHFVELFGSAEASGEWFARLLHGSLVANHTERYRPFGQIAIEALAAMGEKRGISVAPDHAGQVIASLRQLPPYPEVAAALETLSESGVRMATLTNGSMELVTEQLHQSGLSSYFERALSVEAVRRFKPDNVVYRYALNELSVDAGHAAMVAAHDWDIIGARSIGMPGVFVRRDGSFWGLPDTQAELVVPHLGVLADILSTDMKPFA